MWSCVVSKRGAVPPLASKLAGAQLIPRERRGPKERRSAMSYTLPARLSERRMGAIQQKLSRGR